MKHLKDGRGIILVSVRKKKKSKPIRRVFKKIFDLGIFFLTVLVITYLLSNYVVERIVIKNHSMEETIFPDDSVLIDKLSYRFKEPERFDIIVFKQNGTGEELIKRVYGLPHETIQIKDGIFYIDDEPIKDVEGLVPPKDAGIASTPIKLSEGEYFVVGDNREVSIDSRSNEVGLVTSTRIIGRCFFRLLPINRIKLF